MLIILNLKMHFILKNIERYASFFNKLDSKYSIIIAPPVPFIAYLSRKYKNLVFCAQDVSSFNVDGPYTGEYSAEMIKSCGVNYSIVGHSERKLHMDENKSIVMNKIQNILDANMTPIICIGEDYIMRKNGLYKTILIEQLKDFLSPYVIDMVKKGNKIIIAYEPLWAIGTGMTPSIDEISEVSEIINSVLMTLDLSLKNIYLVYGGSVNVANSKKILSLDKINGLLIGSLALDVENIMQITEQS